MNPKRFATTRELINWKRIEWRTQLDDDIDLYKYFSNLPLQAQRIFLKTVLYNVYIPEVPFLNQVKLLTSAWESKEALYGGGRGGGKTSAFVMAGVQFAERYPQWKAGILRLTHKHLTRPNAIMNRAKKWFNMPYLKAEGLDPHGPGENYIFTFPNGAELMFGHVQHDDDVEIYQGAELHRLLLEEAVQFSVYKIERLIGSVRKTVGDVLPINIWSNGNPGGISHGYFNNNFVKGPKLFIPSLYKHNRHLDTDYEDNLNIIAAGNPVLGRQWKDGDWEATPEGKMFKRAWFERHNYDYIDERIVKRLRLWDLAKTDPEDPNNRNDDPDWTAGALLYEGVSGTLYLDNMTRHQKNPDESEEEIFSQAVQDKKIVQLRVEEEGGASPGYLGNTWAKKISKRVPGIDFDMWSVPRASKIQRAAAMVTDIKFGNLKIRNDDWNDDFLAEITVFPTKKVHDDQVDALSGAYAVLKGLTTKDYVRLTEDNWKQLEKWNQ